LKGKTVAEKHLTDEFIQDLGHLQGEFKATVNSFEKAIARFDNTNQIIFDKITATEMNLIEKIDHIHCTKESVFKTYSERIGKLEVTVNPIEESKRGVIFTVKTLRAVWSGVVAVVLFWIAFKTYEMQKQQAKSVVPLTNTTTTNP
jgi:hypothetical protein